MTEQEFSFGPYRLAGRHGPLLFKSYPVNIPPKALSMLWVLISRAGQVVTKDELLATVWEGTIVSEDTLTSFMRLLRRALKDRASQPRYIATVHGVGYRFLPPVTIALPIESSTLQVPSPPLPSISNISQEERVSLPGSWNLTPETPLVGREEELAQLHDLFEKALSGERQMVFVAGEAGIGKTALVEAFLASIRQRGTGNREGGRNKEVLPTPDTRSLLPIVWLGWGQCIEQYGAGEAYLPVLEALGRLGRQPSSERLKEILHHYAPTWLAQLPAFLNPAELEAVQRRVQGATRERMLREITEAIEIISTERPLVLVLEDLHWSDPSTVEWLAMVARRREAARLLVFGTYRSVDLVVTSHPLKAVKQELIGRGLGTEFLLGGLPQEAVCTYLSQRLGERLETLLPQEEMAKFVYRHTEGHPLFMVQVIDYLARQEALPLLSQQALQEIPQGLQQLIDVQLGRLTEAEQAVLEVASVAGAEFTVASVAAGLQESPETIEAFCEGMAHQGQFIEERGIAEWPDGTVSGRYAFRHALYHTVLSQRLAIVRKTRLHRLIGERLADGYGKRAKEIAAELAVHFERGRSYQRAVQFLQQAAGNALQRHAYSEVLALTSRALELIKTTPDPHAHAQQTLAVHFCRLQAILTTKGHASQDTQVAYEQLLALCQEVGTPTQRFSVLLGFGRLHHGHSEYQRTLALSWQCLDIAQREQSPLLLGAAYYMIGVSELLLGNISSAHEALNRGMSYYDPSHHVLFSELYGSNPYVSCRCYDALSLWVLGYPQQAINRANETRAYAQELAHPYTSASALGLTPLVFLCCRQGGEAQQQAEESLVAAEQMEYPFWRAISTFLRGWSLAEQGRHKEGIKQMQHGLAAQQETDSSVHRVHFLVLLAEAYGHVGQVQEGLRLLAEAEASMEKTNERFYEAELWRMKGELLLQQQSGVRRLASTRRRAPLQLR